jgi:hypothetical protein
MSFMIVLMNYVVQMAPSFMSFLIAYVMCHICLVMDAMFWHNDGILSMNMNASKHDTNWYHICICINFLKKRN